MSVTDIKATASGSGGLLGQVAGAGARASGRPFEQVLDQQMALSAPPPAKEGVTAPAGPGVVAALVPEAASTTDDLLALLNQARTPSGPDQNELGAILESGVVAQATGLAMPGQAKLPVADSSAATASDAPSLDGQGRASAVLLDQSFPTPGQSGSPSVRDAQRPHTTQIAPAPLAAAGDLVQVAINAMATVEAEGLAGPAAEATESEADAGTGPRNDASDESELALAQASSQPWPFAPLQAQTAMTQVLNPAEDGVSNSLASQANTVETPDPGELSASAARALASRALGDDAAAPASTTVAAMPADASQWLSRQTDGAPEGIVPGAEDGAQPTPAAALGQSTLSTPPVQPDRLQADTHVQTPLRQAGWDQAISQRVLWMAQDQLQSASLTLNPPHLGPLQVTLQLDAQQASVQFVSPHAEVRQALQDALPVLRELLGQAGLQLGQADVGSRQSRQGEQTFQKPARGSSETAEQDVAAAPEIGSGNRRGGRGLVDLLA